MQANLVQSSFIAHPMFIQQYNEHFLPTMVDNQFEAHQDDIRRALQTPNENPIPYQCPNGHPYFIGNCGRPNGLGQCPECRANIGGRDHAAQGGNRRLESNDSAARTQPGHILGTADGRNRAAAPERDLNSLSCAVLRCLTHLSMYTASLFNIQHVSHICLIYSNINLQFTLTIKYVHQMIRPNLARVEDVRPFIEAHIQLDLQQIAQCCAESTDDCILLLHDVINRMKQANRRGAAHTLGSIAARKQWEKQFDNAYIHPSFHNKTRRIEDVRGRLRTADTVDLRRLLSTSQQPADDSNLASLPGLWGFRRPLSLAIVQNHLNNEQGCSALKNFIGFSEVLVAVQHLPNILQLLKIVSGSFHGEISRDYATSRQIGDFCRRQEREIPELKNLVNSFILAWNSMVTYNRSVGDEQVPELLSTHSILAEFLPDPYVARRPLDQKTYGQAPYELVQFLTDVSNRMLIADKDTHLTFRTYREPVPILDVKSADIISLSSEDELLNLIQSHSEYELRETTSVTYNWPAIEREVIHRYISNKPRIEFSRDQLPSYVYQEDFNLHNQMQTINESQQNLTATQMQSVVRLLPRTHVATLKGKLKELEVIINFLSLKTHIEGEDSLAEYMKETFGREPEYLSQEIRIKHVKHVWLLLKYAQTDLLMKQKQEPFGGIDPQNTEALAEPLPTQLNKCCVFESPKTRLLLRELFAYIILRLNKAAIKQEAEQPDRALEEALQEFIMYRSNYDEEESYQLVNELPTLPEDLMVKHAAKAWCHIWKRFSVA
ncbi:hypothetical protein EB796_000104 [Bugula neritina]|uniref:RZ-type domain-containing protein n=1 Tax=Bugula neritina TaxID=10212 RepID=A0A7J7KTS3_BUGNE|nr:hypothetical protein EB796_000104 [Bugula neritina]